MYTELSTRFSAVSAAAWMFQHSALTLKELQTIQCLRERPTEAAETLLNIIIEQPNAVYNSFLDALKHSNQQHVYQWIAYDTTNGQNNLLYLIMSHLAYDRTKCSKAHDSIFLTTTYSLYTLADMCHIVSPTVNRL